MKEYTIYYGERRIKVGGSTVVKDITTGCHIIMNGSEEIAFVPFVYLITSLAL